MESQIRLDRNRTAIALCDVFQSARPDWDRVIASVSKTSLPKRRGREVHNIQGFLLERHITLILWDMIKEDVGVHEVVLNENPTTVSTYKIKKPDPETFEYQIFTDDGVQQGELDALIKVGRESNALPTVVEVTTSSQDGVNNKNNSLSQSGIEQRLEPLRQYFHTNVFGYIFCVLESVKTQRVSSIIGFSARMGLVAQIPTNEAEVRRAARKYLSSLK